MFHLKTIFIFGSSSSTVSPRSFINKSFLKIICVQCFTTSTIKITWVAMFLFSIYIFDPNNTTDLTFLSDWYCQDIHEKLSPTFKNTFSTIVTESVNRFLWSSYVASHFRLAFRKETFSKIWITFSVVWLSRFLQIASSLISDPMFQERESSLFSISSFITEACLM